MIKTKSRQLLEITEGKSNPENAAFVVVANAILNLDEVLTKN